MQKGKSYRIAMCGMAITLAVVMLAFGHVLTMGEFFWYFVASLLVDVPEPELRRPGRGRLRGLYQGGPASVLQVTSPHPDAKTLRPSGGGFFSALDG